MNAHGPGLLRACVPSASSVSTLSTVLPGDGCLARSSSTKRRCSAGRAAPSRQMSQNDTGPNDAVTSRSATPARSGFCEATAETKAIPSPAAT